MIFKVIRKFGYPYLTYPGMLKRLYVITLLYLTTWIIKIYPLTIFAITQIEYQHHYCYYYYYYYYHYYYYYYYYFYHTGSKKASKMEGPALTAVWSKSPPLTARCLPWVRIPAWACEKVASDLGLGGVFRRVFSTNYNWLVTN